MAPEKDTPPASPSFIPEEEANEDEEELDAEGAVEIIDLDELMDAAEGGEEEGEALEPPQEDNSSLTFKEHGKPVFCCDVHPRDPTLVVTGGEDDRAFVWNAASAEVVMKCDQGFKDSVVHSAFSHDGAFLAAADMSGVVKVWKMASKDIIWEFETSDITWLSWHEATNVLFATTVDSELWMWKLPSSESKVFSGHGERAETACILPDGRRAAVGYGDGSVRVFDLKSGETTHNFDRAHSATVTSIAADSNLVGTGGADGLAKLYNLQSSKVVGTFVCGETKSEGEEEEGDRAAAVESLLFSRGGANDRSGQNLLVTGTLNGAVNIWDISTQVSRQAFNVGSGVVKMTWHSSLPNALLVATLSGTLRVVDVKVGKVVADLSGHTESLLDVSQSGDGGVVVTTSDDGTSKVYNVKEIMSSSS